MITAIIIFAIVASFIIGMALMMIVARRAIELVKIREERRHQELLNQCANNAGIWQDCVNDILDAIEMGRLQNRSIPDQMSLVRKIVLSDTVERNKQEEKGPELITPDE